ncbi:hypothetical protein VIBNISOn1_1810054 [Vibrio nigripulchritudo SOn1]|uniref:Uncharacterized protein n=1 Tax=Vibrio nigripulchritudo SOn1 TaxID=1238450 RepID=A0AAV2VQ54_9VIBR|nr:hypothetical protein VIBNISOn1_1810054 [Vibrio nigripulchritudo SOn1]
MGDGEFKVKKSGHRMPAKPVPAERIVLDPINLSFIGYIIHCGG